MSNAQERGMRDLKPCKTCGHDKRVHIYEEGACRPGFVCEKKCEKFDSDEKPDPDYKRLAEDLAGACEKFKKEFLDKYHPGENWFPETLVIGEALAKYRAAVGK